MTSITASRTIEKLRMIFATHDLPTKIVTDNGPTFISHEFRDFLKECGILHVTSAPYHPATNGLAEHGVQTLKQGLQKLEGNMQDRLSRFLFFYRLSPHATTGVSPTEMLLGRRPRSRLDLLHPDLAQKVRQRQEKQKVNHDNSFPLRTYQVNDCVYAENFGGKPKWLPGRVTRIYGPRSYEIQLQDGTLTRRHVDSIRSRSGADNEEAESSNNDDGALIGIPTSSEETTEEAEEASGRINYFTFTSSGNSTSSYFTNSYTNT